MSDPNQAAPNEGGQDYAGVGDALDWTAPWEPVVLWAELPFWLMVGDCTVNVQVGDHEFKVHVTSICSELHAGEVCDSKARSVYTGTLPAELEPELAKALEKDQVPVLPRKCKTILRIHSRCNADALAAADDPAKRRQRDSRYYLVALCEAHIPVVNSVIQSYRLATYDYFPFEVSPWDVPIWLVDTAAGFIRSVLLPYAEWDRKPQVGPEGGELQEYSLIDPTGLQAATALKPTAGELDLLDARNLMERGDYSGAVRRITTALEAIVESVLGAELLKNHSEAETRKLLKRTQNDFPKRMAKYYEVSGRKLPDELQAEIATTRSMRHAIVHRAYRITFAGRGVAQRAVDTGRWAFDWFENDPERAKIRNEGLAKKSLGRHFTVSVFDAELTKDGVVVHPP